MSIQYIADSQGKTTGVFIPIEDWQQIKLKHEGIEEESLDIPNFHKNFINKRMEKYGRGENETLDFDDAMDAIEKAL